MSRFQYRGRARGRVRFKHHLLGLNNGFPDTRHPTPDT
ncbi:hypothetical protein D1AOALGA4SA_9617 [Olavius algarvensis Delta 1 endosymbiont]|nr:hypothetical protein D1AOALGA4SA_9617 [Olavius algarvensis Delta 1 endosymbiont]